MENNTVIELLEEKTKAFLEYERATEDMLWAPIDNLEDDMQTRAGLIKSIDRLDKAIMEQCEGDSARLSALKCEGDRTKLSPECARIYDGAQSSLAVVVRIRELEPQVQDRMERERGELLQKISENNQSQGALASKFFDAASHFEGEKNPPTQLDRKL